MAKKQLTPEQYKAKAEKKAVKRKKFAGIFFKTAALCLAGAIAYSTTAMAFIKIDRATKAQVVVSDGGNSSSTTPTSTPVQTPTVDWNEGTASTDASSTDKDKADSEKKEATVMTSTTMQFDLFTKALKGVKTNAKSVTQTKKNAYNYDEHVDAKGNVLVESAGRGLMSSLLKPEDTNLTYTGADIAANFPPAGATSGLTKDDVQSIECKEDGNFYIITVVVKGSVNPTAGQSVGAVASILTKESIQDPIKNIPVLNSLTPKCDYKATTAEAKIEKSTGNLVEYYFDLPMYLYMNDYSIGLGFEEWWTVAY